MPSPGLLNLGNTCFVNSCVQVLLKVHEIQAIKPHSAHANPIDSAVLGEWQKLQCGMSADYAADTVINPLSFVQAIHRAAIHKGRELFTGWAQNDMPEFLLFLVETMHSAASRPAKMNIRGASLTDEDRLAVSCYSMLRDVYSKEYSEFMDLFYGICVSRICSRDLDKTFSHKPEPFFILDLPIAPATRANRPVSLVDCLEKFCECELLEGENAWRNDATGETEAGVIKTLSFWNLPPVLVITLKRFSDHSRKNAALVDFPIENLDLADFVEGYSPEKYVYDLFGVCNHFGTVQGGHYTAMAKTGERPGQWTHFNDSRADPVNDVREIVSPAAYCLFYRKRIG